MEESRQTLLSARVFNVVRQSYRSPRGELLIRETVQHPGAVAVLPMLDADHVCLIRNFRIAVGETLIEVPAGTLEPGEDPAETARRELAEETGYRCGRLTKLAEFFMSPGILNERMHLYVAEELTSGETALESGEEIEPWVVNWTAAMDLVKNGTLCDAKSLVALLYYDRFRR